MATFRTENEQISWLQEAAARNQPAGLDRLGTLRHIDDAAKLRAAGAVKLGRSVSLERPLVEGVGYEVEVTYGEPAGVPPSTPAFDVVKLECHGLRLTHVDGLNHFGYGGTLYSGWSREDPDGPSPFDWAATGIFTRALHADISRVRGVDWCDPSEPLTGDDLAGAIAQLGTECLPGDAVLVDMGRDRYEAAGLTPRSQLGAPEDYHQPGMGPDGAEWLMDHKVAVVCWDFLDAVGPHLCNFSGHQMIWTVGQVFVDNVTYTSLHMEEDAGASTGIGALVVAPLAAPRTTGCVINPLFLF
jgi:kynurenine formamidase